MFLSVRDDRTRELAMKMPVELGESYTIGRSDDSDLHLAHFSISRHHGKLIVGRSPAEVWYEDLDSANGSFVDGLPVEGRVLIEPGVEVTIAESKRSIFFHLKDCRDFKTPLKKASEVHDQRLVSHSKDADHENTRPLESTIKKTHRQDFGFSVAKETSKPRGLNMDALANKLRLFETNRAQNSVSSPLGLQNSLVSSARDRSRSRDR